MYRTKCALSVGTDYFANTEVNSDVVQTVYIVRVNQTRMRIVAILQNQFLSFTHSQEREKEKEHKTQNTKDKRHTLFFVTAPEFSCIDRNDAGK